MNAKSIVKADNSEFAKALSERIICYQRERGFESNAPDVLLNDVLYFLGVSLDPKRYWAAPGFNQFKLDLYAFLSNWQPMSTAPRDGTPVLLRYLENFHDERFPLESKRRAGTQFVGWNSGDDSEWGMNAEGGIPDAWLAGWLPLPQSATLVADPDISADGTEATA